jgi:hypothetical protein
LNFQFLVCNSLGDIDGRIYSTEKWLINGRRFGRGLYGTTKTIAYA